MQEKLLNYPNMEYDECCLQRVKHIPTKTLAYCKFIKQTIISFGCKIKRFTLKTNYYRKFDTNGAGYGNFHAVQF